MAKCERVWAVKQYKRGNDWLRYVATVFERQPNARGHYYWRKVKDLCRPCSAPEAAKAGRKSGLPREESAENNARAWRLGDYVDAVTQATTRLGGCYLGLLVRRKATSWYTVAVGIRQGHGRWKVVAHLGWLTDTADSPAAYTQIARMLGLRCYSVAQLPIQPGMEAPTQSELDTEACNKRLAKERARKAKARRKKRGIAEAEATGDSDRLARLRTGKGRVKRERAGRKAARTRKRKAKAKAKRSRAAQKAWKTRRENEEKRARRSEAAKRAWATRRKGSKR